MKILAFVLVAYLFVPGFSFAQPNESREVYLNLLTVLRYADTFRMSVRQTCPRLINSGNYKILNLCKNMNKITDSRINEEAVPFVSRCVSLVEAQEAIAFWSSPQGVEIQNKIISHMEAGGGELNPEQIRLLDFANKSSYGRALAKFAEDVGASTVIIKNLAEDQMLR